MYYKYINSKEINDGKSFLLYFKLNLKSNKILRKFAKRKTKLDQEYIIENLLYLQSKKGNRERKTMVISSAKEGTPLRRITSANFKFFSPLPLYIPPFFISPYALYLSNYWQKLQFSAFSHNFPSEGARGINQSSYIRYIAGIQDITRIKADAHIVVPPPWGKVNNNKCRVSIVCTGPEGLQINKVCVFGSIPIGELMRQQISL